MNKIIITFSILAMYGCANKPIVTPQSSMQSGPSSTQMSGHDATQQSRVSTPEAKFSAPAAKRGLISNRPFRHHTTLSMHKPVDHKEPEKQEALIPRITRYIKQGMASWYGAKFHGRKTATGEIFDMYAMTAAHKTLPIPSYAQVTNLENNRSVIVRINDRGPYVGNRLLDLSYAAAKKLDIHKNGLGHVEIVALTNDQALPKLNKAKDDR